MSNSSYPSNSSNSSNQQSNLDASDNTSDLLVALNVYIPVPLTLAGCVANVINIAVFCRMDRQQTINISLLAMAVSDLLRLLGTLWRCVCFLPVVVQSDNLTFEPLDMAMGIGDVIRFVFSRITACLTLLISAERCLCILIPLKVKTLVTIGKIKTIVIAIYICTVASMSWIYYFNRFEWEYSTERNKTVLIFKPNEDDNDIEMSLIVVNNVLMQYVISIGIGIFTAILVTKMRQQSKWRLSSSKQAASEASARRDDKVAKTVTVISVTYLVCYFPNTVNMMCMYLVPGYTFFGRYSDLLVNISVAVYLFEIINSSVNIFFYWELSTQFRKEMKRLFGCATTP
ncbi:phe13-bombesin receptor-like [Aplysia californica]|uniref:Phe13-bombesin receptor-like n=1 Tax=Aplysia californica TaxID=6500 RepID=A0ABM0JPC0_APLCA|nr:phe13-bombesin receptor-like [Aplysia californica]